MTTDHIVTTVIWWTAVAVFVTRWLVREWEWYRDSRRERRKKLLQDIANLERELGMGQVPPAGDELPPRVPPMRGGTWSGRRNTTGEVADG
jgi:hypothetical protein